MVYIYLFILVPALFNCVAPNIGVIFLCILVNYFNKLLKKTYFFLILCYNIYIYIDKYI